MFDFGKENLLNDKKNAINGNDEQQPLTSIISSNEQFQLKQSLKIIEEAINDLTRYDTLKQSLVIIRNELKNIDNASHKFHLVLFNESKIALIVIINWHLSELCVFDEKDMSNFIQHFNTLKLIVKNQGEGFY